jgi:hypothetical protein
MGEQFSKLMGEVKPDRRWAQLSLRTLLVIVTVLCVVLGMWIVPAERQRRAVAAIEAVGGSVEYAEADNTGTRQSLTCKRYRVCKSLASKTLRSRTPGCPTSTD